MSILLRGNDYGIDISPKNCENSKQILSSRIALATAMQDSGGMLLSFAVVTDEACSLPSLTDNTKCSGRDATYRDQHKTPYIRASLAACSLPRLTIIPNAEAGM